MHPRCLGLAATPARRRATENALVFLLLVAALLKYPNYPAAELDLSWAMVLDYAFRNSLQFGRDVVFTFGPLGFVYANTYTGLHFVSLVVVQIIFDSACAAVIILNSVGLSGIRRLVYYGFFTLLMFGSVDSQVAIVILLAGMELIRRSDQHWRTGSTLLVVFLAFLAQIKFTYLILAGIAVAATCLASFIQGRRRTGVLALLWFLGSFLGIWMASNQSLLALTDYLQNSRQISQGFNAAMGLHTPPRAFFLALVILAGLSIYMLIYLVSDYRKTTRWIRAGWVVIFLFFLWKQGFVRSDGHMLVFFIGALLPVVAFPALLDDSGRWRPFVQILLIAVGLTAILGIRFLEKEFGWRDMLAKSCALAEVRNKLVRHCDFASSPAALQSSYKARLIGEKNKIPLPRSQATIGQATLDVIGHQQAVALYYGFNYHPRPVFQSYAVFNAFLARLNEAYYRSPRAPEFVLFKLQTIDNRLPTLDDSLILRSLPFRYEYLHPEKGFLLWRRREHPQLPDGEPAALLRSESLRINQPFPFQELADKRLWAEIAIRPSLFGRLRNAIYKLPVVELKLEDTSGRTWGSRLPHAQAEAGFILNPMILEQSDYLCFAVGVMTKRVHALTVAVDKEDERFFLNKATIRLFELPPAPEMSGACEDPRMLFWMFNSIPETHKASLPLAHVQIGDKDTMLMHAPSEMVFAFPEGAKAVTGQFGYIPAAYQGLARTDGAIFQILWSNGVDNIELFRRRLDPLHLAADRGLQAFNVDITQLSGGELILKVDPGINANWDWTTWAEIEIR